MAPRARRPPSGDEIVALRRCALRSRAVCVLGHVDHGKSSLVDWLLAENGHIPARLAGTLRFLDDTVDEQERGITMRASAISLVHARAGPGPRWEPDSAEKRPRDYLLTLVDSPGHIDFSHDACAATRLSDGAVIVVDVVEGVRVQTASALRAACAERLRPVLVLNKVDRLCLETLDGPVEAFLRLRRVLENVNVVLHEALALHGCDAAFGAAAAFAAEKGNVVFASALEGWGFTALQVAKVLLPKFPAGTTPKKVAMILFGDFCLNEDEGKVTKLRDPTYPDGAIFPKLVLEPLWALLSGETEDALGEWFVKPDSKRKQTAREAASTCLRTKFKVADAVCRAVVDKVAPPEVAFSERLPALLQSSESELGPVLAACDRDGGAIVYVAKQILVNGTLGCAARVFSGTVAVGSRLRVAETGVDVEVDRVSAMMGGDAVDVPEASAGAVVSLGAAVAAALGPLKRATLFGSRLFEEGEPLGGLAAPKGANAYPLVRVAVDAASRGDAQGRKRVIQRRFNVGVLEAMSEKKASTL